jgi:hypothetical protein
MINAIETRYAGCYFRSRLEARWAVFFDTLGIEWQYEPEGFDLGEGVAFDPNDPFYETYRQDAGPYWSVPYLPDFYLPTTQTWVEVKGSADAFEWGKLARAVDFGRLPHTANSYGFYDKGSLTRGLLLLGPVPRPTPNHTPTFPIIQHDEGCRLTPAVILDQPCTLGKLQQVNPQIELEYDEFFDQYGWNDDRDEWVQAVKRTWSENVGWVKAPNNARADAALRAARSARFGT